MNSCSFLTSESWEECSRYDFAYNTSRKFVLYLFFFNSETGMLPTTTLHYYHYCFIYRPTVLLNPSNKVFRPLSKVLRFSNYSHIHLIWLKSISCSSLKEQRVTTLYMTLAIRFQFLLILWHPHENFFVLVKYTRVFRRVLKDDASRAPPICLLRSLS